MADVKITQLPPATSPVAPTDVLPVVQGGDTKRASIAQLGFLQLGSGAQTRTIQSKLRDVVSVKDFGAVGDGVTDDTTAIQAALNFCETNGFSISGVPGTYKITSTLVINCSGNLSDMTISADATVVSTAVRVGPNGAGQYLFDADIVLPFVNNPAKTSTGWSGFDSAIGVEIANVYQSRITVPSIYNFGIGLKVGGYSVGNVYNTFVIGVLFGNKINLQCKPGDAAGWSNQNLYIGGRYAHASGEGTAVSGVIHIQLRDFDATGPSAPNNNTWINPSVEGNEQEFHLDIQGTFNTFVSPRLEVATAVPARVNYHAVSANETASNSIIGGYDIAGITYTFSGAGTSVRNKRYGGTANDAFEYSANGINIVNRTGSSRSAPHIQGFLASQSAVAKTEASTDWIYRLHGDGLSVKSSGDTQDRVQITASGYLYFGRGSAAPTAGFRAGTLGEVNAQSVLQPETDNAVSLGAAARRWTTVHSVNAKFSAVTVANLPAAATAGAGAKAFVSDANATTFASVVAGGGANNVPVYSDGTNWRIG